MSGSRALIALQGPRAVDVLGAAAPRRRGPALHGLARFRRRPDQHLRLALAATPARTASRSRCVASNAESFAKALLDNPEVAPAGLGARDSLRLEAGLLLYGHDLDETTDPVEAGLAWSIGKRRRDEGGFPGFARIARRCVTGRRGCASVCCRKARRRCARAPDHRHDGEVVGHVTSGGFSPTLQRPIAMGYVARARASPATPLATDLRGKPVELDVAPLPFVAHRYVQTRKDAT